LRIKRIHVNQHNLKCNIKNKTKKPVFTIKVGTENFKTSRVKIEGPSELVYPGKQLNCGARAWIETTAKVVTARGKVIE
jgi:hypothetical protein